jgi:transcriptional regulator with PAS, ATPase and Fis domain
MKKILIIYVPEGTLYEDGQLASHCTSHRDPIVRAIDKISFDKIILKKTVPTNEFQAYVSWLKSITKTKIIISQASDQNKCRTISLFEECKGCIDTLENMENLTVVTSEMLFSSVGEGKAFNRHIKDFMVESKKFGEFNLYGVHLNPMTYRRIQRDVLFEKLASGSSSVANPKFKNIVHSSDKMEKLIKKAEIVAKNRATVLIQGESGTGKELLARAIHKASARSEGLFIAVNCGAIPSELVESAFFGHIKGSFTGAVNNRDGYFKCADNGTLFLDEVGELPLAAQVKILRIIQEGELTPVGATKAIPVNVRIIAATNRSLANEMAHGRFREDLFYRLAVAILDIPPLRDRIEDMDPLIDHIMKGVDDQQRTKVHSSARTLLKRHRWPGNVRELQNALLRASLWSGNVIMANDIQEALLAVDPRSGDQAIDHPFTQNFELQSVLDEVSRHYLARAIKEAGGNKTKAAKLLGFKNQQTLTNWLKKLD